MAGFAIPIGLAFGRMGCLLAGCCFGATDQAAVGALVPAAQPGERGAGQGAHLAERPRCGAQPVHPTQIYESAVSLAIAAFCLFCVLPRKRYDGQVFAASLALYAVARFLVEILRRDDARRCGSASRRRSSSASGCSWRRRSSTVPARERAPRRARGGGARLR